MSGPQILHSFCVYQNQGKHLSSWSCEGVRDESEVESSSLRYVTPCRLVNSYQTTRRSIPEYVNLQQHRSTNLKSHEGNLSHLHDMKVNGEVEV
jgi:hypothetical protein